MAKEATNPKTNMQRELYCLAVHKNTSERTFEYAGAEKQTAEKVGFRHLSSFFLQNWSSNTTPFWATHKGRGSEVCLLRMRSSHANAFHHSAYDGCVRGAFRIFSEKFFLLLVQCTIIHAHTCCTTYIANMAKFMPGYCEQVGKQFDESASLFT